MKRSADRDGARTGLRRQVAAIACVLAIAALGPVGCGDDAPPQEALAPEPDPQTIKGPLGREWRRLSRDGLHDEANEMLQYLQEPAEALGTLPIDGPEGNKVDWMAALEQGAIAPRTNIRPETKIRVLDLDIIFADTAGQPQVVFPHRQHTEWLDCTNCHPKIFRAKKGANDFGMLDVLQGEYCGRCHGAVAFPLTQCRRCHSRDREGGLTR